MKAFFIKRGEQVERKYVLLAVSYYCYISESKKMSKVRHVASVESLCVRGMVTGEGIISDQMAKGASMRNKEAVEMGLLKMQRTIL